MTKEINDKCWPGPTCVQVTIVICMVVPYVPGVINFRSLFYGYYFLKGNTALVPEIIIYSLSKNYLRIRYFPNLIKGMILSYPVNYFSYNTAIKEL